MTWRRWTLMIVLTAWAAFVARSWYEREIVVEIGGTYENMRKQSSARFSPPYPDGGISWGGAKSNARLRFLDPQYGFITPIGTSFTMGFKGNTIGDVRISPQTEPLLLDDALKVVLDLQEQWRRGGWIDRNHKKYPPFADTPQWRAQLRDKGGITYWYAGDKYQAMLTVHRFEDRKRPEEERYKITLEVAKPWTPYP
ncbi:hypothetical protein QN366_13690 [Pseudomonas sp. CCC3.2]|uniref:hypothetical protein n=1 Tax=unclassified Pseudomonas TaxID=196821 RepID=UPI002AB46480|nr:MULTISPECIES: hypothetical protein [unclassified Pseudomonas]MDY7562334.1 hypothetical protein [Pseudomonas sp. AB6]MEA9976368.1 hypothetical protein [Pseudomonas sp. RTS4]MEB0181106.1 hypothetical protein [Pseudomonas sp. CCC3.2]MEB0199199.1 hypothetical protein [Pseudomonas sp. 5S4]MEB0213188.1 hypothetical protein [Pseudomonas sp. AB6]